MSRLRPELTETNTPSMSYESAYFRVLQAVARKRSLIHGRLHSGNRSCAIGSAFDDGVKSVYRRDFDAARRNKVSVSWSSSST